MTPTFKTGDHVMVLSKFGNLEGIITGIGFTGRGEQIPLYRLDTIIGPVTSPGKNLAPATNVTMLRHEAWDTRPCEMKG